MTKPTEKVNNLIKTASGLAGSVAALSALFVTVFGFDVVKTTTFLSIGAVVLLVIAYMVERVISSMDAKLGEMEKRMVERDKEQDRSLCRLELVDLMRHQPNNKVAIERKAKHYFSDLNGNDWMSATYSDWAKKYKGDITFVIQH